MPGESVAIRLGEGRWSAADIAARAHRVQKIAHGEHSADGIGRIALTPWVECFATLRDHFRGQRNICGDHQVSGRHTLDDFVIGHVKTGRYSNGAQAGNSGYLQRLIRHQRHQHSGAFGGAKQYFLDDIRTCIRVDPNACRCHH